jgi:phosphatidylinositol glycan class C protein
MMEEREISRVLKAPQTKQEALDAMMIKFSSKPDPKTLSNLCSGSLVVGQEFVLACLLLARHRVAMQYEQEQESIEYSGEVISMVAVSLTLFSVILFTDTDGGRRKNKPSLRKLTTRTRDALLLAGILRLVSAVLRTLTASYSSDTVHALAIGGLLVHLLFCDYSYANGRTITSATTTSDDGRQVFLGGTMSLNSVLFSTTLLASRLSSNSTVYGFVSSAVILFCFYPAARNRISSLPQGTYGKDD